MPSLINSLRINDTNFSYGSAVFRFDGMPKRGLLALDFEQSRERKIVHDNAPDQTPVGRTTGKYEVKSLSTKFLVDEWKSLTDYMSVKGLGSYGDAVVTIQVQCVEPGNLPLIIVASGCTVMSEKEGYEEGIDETLTEVSWQCLRITRNGNRLWSVQKALSGIV